MKRIFTLFIFLVFTTVGFAQLDCSKFYQLKEGYSYEITSYNKKGKVSLLTRYKIKSASNNKAVLFAETLDKKQKPTYSAEYDVTCTENGVEVDFKSLMNSEVLAPYKDSKIDVTGTNLILPNSLKVGQTLPDANVNAEIDVMGAMKMNFNVDIKDRKVESKESITTSAGTFDCFVITYTSDLKMGMNRTFKTKQWLAEGVGLIKTEEYNDKGKLMSYSELTKLSK